MRVIGVLLLIFAAVFVWYAIVELEGIPELTLCTIGSAAIGLFVCLFKKDCDDFEDAFSASYIVTSVSFFITTFSLSFIFPTAAMYSPLTVGAVLGILVISALVGLAPALVISILNAIVKRIIR